MSQQRGRLTRAQRRALDELGHKYDFKSQPFEQTAPLGVEIGFGMGEALANWSQACPEWNLLGIEIYPSGLGAMLNRIEQEELTNVRLTSDRAEEVLAENLGEASVQEFRILFPDPWPKKRHHKRRIVSESLLSHAARLLKPGSELRIASDIPDYIRWTLLHVQMHNRRSHDFEWTAKCADDWKVRPDDWPQTRYEAKAIREGRTGTYLKFIRR